MLTVPFGIIAQKIDSIIVKSNDVLSDRALEDAKTANVGAIERKNYYGLVKVFLFVVFYLLTVQAILVPAVIWVYPRFNATIVNMLSLTYYFLPLLGIAVALNTIKLRGAVPVFCAVFLIAAVARELFHVY
jgi:PTS system mannose-specific IIC component